MRILKRVRVVAAALGVVAGTLLASAGPGTSVSQAATPADGAAAAASRIYGVEIVKQGGVVGDLQTQSVRCPQRKVPIGGGGETSFGHTPWGHEIQLVSSVPLIEGGQPVGWRTSAHKAVSLDMTLTTYAVCAYPPSGYQLVQSPVTPSPYDTLTTLSCPAGKVALGGGGEAIGSGSWLSKSYPAPVSGTAQPTQWALGTAGWDTTTAVVHAVCTDPVYALTVTHYNAASESPYGGLLKCPAGTVVAGGGASANGPSASLFSSRPAKAAETGSRDGWWAQGSDNLQSSNIDLYVMCTEPV
ncbi:hypothetical protein [Streptomyces sp. rh34]|uniref:hypothetical protein n=1 Tax=Streptomyces sp. rh34 TaxID=2034272 RepID=UPI00117D1090|nr:hypothetical protein [Streptomyces sp. rh34]